MAFAGGKADKGQELRFNLRPASLKLAAGVSQRIGRMLPGEGEPSLTPRKCLGGCKPHPRPQRGCLDDPRRANLAGVGSGIKARLLNGKMLWGGHAASPPKIKKKKKMKKINALHHAAVLSQTPKGNQPTGSAPGRTRIVPGWFFGGAGGRRRPPKKVAVSPAAPAAPGGSSPVVDFSLILV